MVGRFYRTIDGCQMDGCHMGTTLRTLLALFLLAPFFTWLQPFSIGRYLNGVITANIFLNFGE